jgi:sorting nexin-1/2
MQLDADENEDTFYKPPIEPSARRSEEQSTTETESSIGTGTIAAEDDD